MYRLRHAIEQIKMEVRAFDFEEKEAFLRFRRIFFGRIDRDQSDVTKEVRGSVGLVRYAMGLQGVLNRSRSTYVHESQKRCGRQLVWNDSRFRNANTITAWLAYLDYGEADLLQREAGVCARLIREKERSNKRSSGVSKE